MRVIAKTDNGYLVEATGDELAHAAGYRLVNSNIPGARVERGSYSDEWVLPINTKVDVTAAHNYLHELRQQEDKVKSSAAFLRGMADMMDAALPTTIIPPNEAEKDAEK
jgi:hypothetical protein